MNTTRIEQLPPTEKPIFRVTHKPEHCNMIELIAAVVGGPRQLEIAEALLLRFGDIAGLHRAHITDIRSVEGIGPSTAARIKAALLLGKRLASYVPEQRPAIRSPRDAAALVQHDMNNLEQEHLRVLVLNTRSELLEIAEIYKGCVNSSPVRIAEIMRPAVRRNAPSIIVAHNHPSGDPQPSRDDTSITREIVEVGHLMGIEVLDHLVIGRGASWKSMKELGLGFSKGNRVNERKNKYQI